MPRLRPTMEIRRTLDSFHFHSHSSSISTSLNMPQAYHYWTIIESKFGKQCHWRSNEGYVQEGSLVDIPIFGTVEIIEKLEPDESEQRRYIVKHLQTKEHTVMRNLRHQPILRRRETLILSSPSPRPTFIYVENLPAPRRLHRRGRK